MQGIHEFIVEVEHPFKDKIKYGNLELMVDSDYDRFNLSNREGTVISVPMNEKTPVEVGDEVMLVQTVLMPHITKDGRKPSPHLVDGEKGWYRAEPNLIVMYRKKGQNWKCFGSNVFIERIEKPTETTSRSGLIVPVHLTKQYEEFSRVAFDSELLEEHGIKKGDLIYHRPDLHPYEIDGETFHRIPFDFIHGQKN